VRPTRVEVDLDAVAANVRTIAELVAPAGVCAVVKADAYGHGDVPVAEVALDAGATTLAVALVEEGLRLREAGIEDPILLLSEPVAGDADLVADAGLTPTVYTHDLVRALAGTGTSLDVHLKVDTGMHRVGAPPDVAADIASDIGVLDGIRLAGVWTHLAVAEEDVDYTSVQIGRFRAFLARLAEAGIEPGVRHVANTAGAMAYPEARFDMVRLGLGMYGMRPAPDTAPDVPLVPAMRVVSEVSYVRRHPAGTRPSYGRRRPLERESTVVTVPIGYADGVSRRLSSVGGEVLIAGVRRPFAGTVTMDQIVVDVGDTPVRVGDEVVLLGAQGDEAITADEWADRLDTINYEITCHFGPRVPRRHTGGSV
jgi:alanine racemase